MKTKEKIIQAFKVWIVIYPSITLFNMVFGAFLNSLSVYMKTFTLTVVLVPWMIFVGLPFVNKLQQKISKNEKA